MFIMKNLTKVSYYMQT